MKTEERRHHPQAQQSRAKVERIQRFDDDLVQMVVFAAVVVLTIVALIVAAA
jgi:hypothetical protein